MPSIDLSRRNVLVGFVPVAGGVLSGCTSRLFSGGSPPGSTSSSGSTLHLRLVPIGPSLVDRHVVDLAETRIEWDEAAFEAALDGADYTIQYRQPFPVRNGDDPAYTYRDGTYYRLDAVVVGEEAVPRSVLRLYEVGRQGESSDLPEFTPHEALPAVDRRAVQVAHLAARARGNEGGMPVGLVQRGGFVYRSDDREEGSRLLAESGPAHVGYRGAVYRVDVSEETFYEPIYRPDVEPVAESEEDMEAVLRAMFVDSRIDPASLTRDERQIVREARGDGYEESHPYSDAYVSLLEALDRRAFIDGDIENDGGIDRDRTDVLKYGDEYYDYRLRLEP